MSANFCHRKLNYIKELLKIQCQPKSQLLIENIIQTILQKEIRIPLLIVICKNKSTLSKNLT